ncbi:MAG: hypothetical protein EXR71_10855 [Myxococcales bacterium]|nr:hypothetical protein [Myxococcales bacterium]
MIPFLLVAATAHGACQLMQTANGTGTVVLVQAIAEPLSCRRVTVRSSRPIPKIGVAIGHRRVQRDHVRFGDREVEVGLPELKVGDEVRFDIALAADDVEIILGPPPPRATGAEETHVTWTVAVDPKHPGWGFADPKFATTRKEVATVEPAGRAVVDEPGAAATGVLKLAPGSFTLDAPGASMTGWGSAGVTVTRTPNKLLFVAPEGGEARWRVSSMAGASVIPDEQTFVEGLDWRFRQVSLPEPAVPVRYAALTDPEALARALYGDVQVLVDGWLPGRSPLHPRQLNRAWRSGWATPVEHALILDRLLKQAQLVSAWMLTGDSPEFMTLTGYDHMLVAVRVGDRDVLLDPACTVCAFDEVSTRVAGKRAVGAAAVVPLSVGELRRKLSLVGSEFGAVVNASGAAALWLREAVVGFGEVRRHEVLASSLGMAGARVTLVEGLDAMGEPIRVELASPRPPSPVFVTEPPWIGGWVDE